MRSDNYGRDVRICTARRYNHQEKTIVDAIRREREQANKTAADK
jgi:hypothetical protein